VEKGEEGLARIEQIRGAGNAGGRGNPVGGTVLVLNLKRTMGKGKRITARANSRDFVH
jgi:hypothetical protein